ncbi:UDP-4-amino-4,6-dideoxy-N-acetyl-beta-L-altrosamine transaminase [Paenibacillus qinlingensis]|uniref:UDP-4-amino-4, 6-dideoxy-N-acetyl-beta-L-altrosamine transaminase n=1 Tax=Paenibacillus qinlingensis TaxID=1837343 RepID=A0ABU1P1K7_9BACL|nr:UDP-4-amino-4,6-dideoxy-N-acetyl-beta-L-altrosamine transaminase [Paenibacillus qinlingensis]MDR6553598.1 UDP-4-amino-4,6-dideoxy-N-acetyl-beta-L-altrosamine transaminase [Paenibacillus qinlingensis]
MELAINGGTSVRSKMLPYGQQWLNDDDINEVIQVLRSDFLTQGPKIAEFEAVVANYVGAKYAVAFSNGTAALHAACFACGIEQGDEVITTPITFAASSNCALYMGAKPVFVDIDDQTYNINPDLIEAAVTPKTKAIVAVDFTGQPVNMDKIKQIADKYNLTIIQDSAHSLGATYKGQKVGSLADMTMFSFHPVKHITTGEGGMIVTDDADYAKKLKLFRSHGITREDIAEDKGPWYYEMTALGYNYRMTDIQAALGISQLKRLDEFVDRRKALIEMYNEEFQHLDVAITPFQLADTDSSWHLYILRLNLEKLSADRKQIFKALQAENIGVNIHYIPVYFHPYYQGLGYEKGLCPIAEKWYEEVITLPLFPKMTEDDVRDVIEAVKKVLSYYIFK